MRALAGQKAVARRAAFDRRKLARAADDGTVGAAAAARLAAFLAPHRGKVLSGYMPIRTEISPLGVMAGMAAHGPVCVPVIAGRGRPLRFRLWTPETEMMAGAFGALVPAKGPFIDPDVLIVPLAAFDAQGWRLGYGGGFYDRTLAGLRARRPTVAVGFAYAAQQVDAVPRGATDQRLDALVTEAETLRFS